MTLGPVMLLRFYFVLRFVVGFGFVSVVVVVVVVVIVVIVIVIAIVIVVIVISNVILYAVILSGDPTVISHKCTQSHAFYI